ncbi:MAG: DUF885 domain-containing protein [Acidimicrobiales bacterium]
MSFSLLLADLTENIDGLSEPERLHALFDLCWDHHLEDFPEQATSFGVSGHGHRWTDRSESAIDRRKGERRDVLTAVRSIDATQLEDTDRLSLELMRRRYAQSVDGQSLPRELMPISMMGGPQTSLVRTFERMPTGQLGHLDDHIARLHGVGVYLDQLIGLMEEGIARNVTPARLTVEDIPRQLEALLETPTQNSPFLVGFAARAPHMDQAEFDDLRADAVDALENATQPALRRFIGFLRDTYLPACRTTIACADLPDGEAWYRHQVRQFTTTSMDPAEIHELGVAEVKRIRSEMDEAMVDAGHTGTFEEFCDHLRTSPEFFHTTAEDLLRGYRDIAKRIDAGLPRLFGVLPRLPYGICPIPDHEAPNTTTAYYLRGSIEAKRPGWFAANTYDLNSRPTWEMEALTLHEAVPGHHLQLALQAELDGLPKQRTMGIGADEHDIGDTAYVEGWGLYAEKLGSELGLYTDPHSRFGQLTYEMWRAVRLVVDTGIHAFGWTRQQAIDFFAANSSKPIHDITVEVDRYISWPGQALAYKLGELTFLRLRAEATDALGSRFDISAFHDHVLGAGALPLDMLEERFRNWLADA